MTSQQVRLLAIDLGNAAPAVRSALAMNPTELDELVGRVRALEGKLDLVVFADRTRLELYSTEASSTKAFRAVLRELISRGGGREKLSDLTTIEASGVAAAQHLLRLAVGIGGASGLENLCALNLAVARSRRAGMLGRESSALFTSAAEAAWRAYCETAVSDATRSEAEREVAALEAERIAEEALVSWKAKCLAPVKARRRALSSGVFLTRPNRIRVA